MNILIKAKNSLKCKKGMTLTSVMVAFVVLLIVIIMFNQSFNLSARIYKRAEDIRTSIEGLFTEFYSKTSYEKKSGTGDYSGGNKTYTFTTESGQSFTINSKENYYQSAGGSKVYFFGNRKSNIS